MIKAFSIAAAVLALTIGSKNAQADGGPGAATPKNTTSPNGMAQPPGIQDRPKTYQPANPAPDPRAAPTSSSAGVGSDSGGHPENQPKN